VTERREAEPEQHGSLARSTLHGVLWMTAGRFMKAPTNLIAVAILARLLTPTDFGVVAIGFVVTALATMIVDGTFGMVLVQRPTIDPPLIGASLLLSALLGSLFGVALIFSGPLIQRYFDFPDLSGVLRLLAMVLPISAAMAVSSALLQRASRFGVLTVNSFIAQLVNAIVAIAMAFAGFGVWALVWSQLAQVIVETALGYWAVRARYTLGFSLAAVSDAIRSGGMFTVSKMFNWASGNMDKIVVGRLLGAASLGLYSRANTLMATANQLVGTGTARVLFSTFARMQHDLDRMERAFDRALSTSMVGASLASAFVILFADPIVRILLGPQWLDTVPVLQALFAAFITRSGYVVAEAVPLALGLARISAYRQAAQFFLVIIGAWVGSRFGVVGAAIGIATAYWIFYLLCLVLVQQLLDVRTSRLLRIHLKGLAVAAPPVVTTLALDAIFNTHGSLILDMVLMVIFGLVSALVIFFGPDSLLSDDIVRMRGYLVQLVRKRLRLAT
jgi:PST family polysaccharide transporter